MTLANLLRVRVLVNGQQGRYSVANMKKTKTTEEIIADLRKQVQQLQELISQLKGDIASIERELNR